MKRSEAVRKRRLEQKLAGQAPPGCPSTSSTSCCSFCWRWSSGT
ncbi:MAG: hypothetical protein U1F87_01155 [Kiritimatiellia bacterium]